MLNASYIQILVVLGLPYAVKAVRSFFAKAPPPSPLQRLNNKHKEDISPKTRSWNRFILALLSLTTLYHLYNVALYNPPNIFRALSLPPDCPNFILHQSWKEYADHHPGFMDKYPDSMRERFKAMEYRLWYEVYGQDAFLNCDHCTEQSDFMLYLIPGALASYMSMGIILGLATTQTSHLNKYRSWGAAALVLFAVLEYGIYQRSAGFGTLNGLMNDDAWLVGYTGAHRLRHGALALMSAVIIALLQRSGRSGGSRDEIEILNDLCHAQEAMIQRHRALQLARVASLRHETLRKQFVEYWKRREIEHSLLLGDSEYREARDLALSRIDIDAITQQADQYIDAIISAGERVPEMSDELDTSSSVTEDLKKSS
ncbi:hypothetical protein BX616_005711 [Lobosporangium transversale]|uniref:Uncharacterized protein n=1 Tax=Lobosporangium transversale TaxID=64571 RepID=A0A1Y2GHC9_9FUNG|nr:hypothetical protein BCR41DRAFT_423656 [Lobosporangium transversale]XP_021879833.1 hypothetical protein BCR41DRAFT_387686 [Lobosporangium transversale]KAF9915620.1 hypothetical protein BX616_005711 [Lobosporangium transversale]ORZ10958.1 hypothetical protein BCR41DRAFT_423656 [Lobosporangium transversale]ORZ11736.1 hypothetical protein BCR41DRAFT_387686 [Lobosporangium transversale]|eukprot:XP_021879475.1 hypothetical protein BCR41DRAFT_423656 [Lobosporangium transversale]